MRAIKVLRKYLLLLLALAVFAAVHESVHILTAAAFGEFNGFHLKPYGFEVEFRTPVSERTGVEWGLISGSSNLATIAIDYVMYSQRRMISLQNSTLYILGYWLTLCFLILDPLNLSVGPFIYGGDVYGVSVGFSVNQYIIQAAFLGLFLLNRELLVQRLIPLYKVETRHPLFQPLLKRKGSPKEP